VRGWLAGQNCLPGLLHERRGRPVAVLTGGMVAWRGVRLAVAVGRCSCRPTLRAGARCWRLCRRQVAVVVAGAARALLLAVWQRREQEQEEWEAWVGRAHPSARRGAAAS
jgi:hypothetical protein